MKQTLRVLNLVLLLVLCGATPWLAATGFSFQGYVSSAPTSIPIPESGTVNVAMARLQFRSGVNGDYSSFSSISLSLSTTGSFSQADVQAIKIYFERNGDGLWSTTDSTIMAAGGPYTFSGGTAIIPLDAASHYFDWGGSDYIHVVLEFKSSSDTASTVGCEITSVTYGAQYVGTGSTYNPAAHNTQKPLDTWRASLTATGIAPASADQTVQNVPVLKLAMAAVDASVTMDLDSITLQSLGTADADVASGGVLLYEDTNTNGTFESGSDTLLTSGTLSGGNVTLNPTANIQFTSTGKTFFVAVNVAVAATVGHTIGLEVDNPSTSLTFLDTITDSYVLTQYMQKGYLLSTSATPTSGNTFTVTEYVPFIVTEISPISGATGVPRDVNVTAKFGRSVDDTTLAANFTLAGDIHGAVDADMGYDDGIKTATLNPTGDLYLGEQYTATITVGVLDTLGNPLEAQKQWSFTVVAASPVFCK